MLQFNHKNEIIIDTLVFNPHTIPIPSVNINNFLRQTASDIDTLLKRPQSILPTSLQIGNQICNGLFQLATILKTNKANIILTTVIFNHQISTYSFHQNNLLNDINPFMKI